MIRKFFPLTLVALLSIVACNDENETPTPAEPVQLQTPVLSVNNVTETSFTISWTAIENASGYAYQLNDGAESTITATSVTFEELEAGDYTVKVKATSATPDTYTDSEWASITQTVEGTPEPKEFTVDIQILEVNETDASITVTPSDDDTYFFARVITVAELITFDIYEYDEDIITYMMENPDREDYVYKGEQSLNPTRLQPDYDYMVVAFDYLSPGKLFKKEFTTKETHQESHFEISNIEVGFTDVTFTVTPNDNSEYWYFEWMLTENYEGYGDNAIIHAYYGLQNLALMAGYTNIGAYLETTAMQGEDNVYINDLKNETGYTVMVFYVDPDNSDPTQIYDWNYTPVSITTLAPTGDNEPVIMLSNPVVVDRGSGIYDLQITAVANSAVTQMKAGVALYESCSAYYDQGWEAIKAFFWLRDLGADALDAAKSENGYVFTKTDLEAGDYVVLFEACNAEGVMVYDGFRFEPSLFE